MKKITLLFLICISAFQVLKAQDTLIWAPAGTYPNISQAGHFNATAIIGNTLYAHLTINGLTATATIQKYQITDPSVGGGSWIAGTDLPTALIGGNMVECGNKLYYIGGSTTGASDAGDAVYCFDPGTSVWTAKASLPVPLVGHGSVVWGDSVIFVMGGPWSTTPTTNLDVYYYRPSTDTWGTITGASGLPSGAGRRTFALGIDDNKIIIAGGYAGAYIQSAYVGTIGSNATQITWAQVDDIPGASGLSRPGGIAIDGRFFLIGGEAPAKGVENITHVYNFTSNEWEFSFPGKPFATSNINSAVVAKKLSGNITVLFTVGGYDGASSLTCFDVAKFYDPTAGLEEFAAQHFSVFPNPAHDVITINPSVNETVGNIEVLNIFGQVIDVVQMHGKTDLNISGYPAGLYIVQMKETGFAVSFVKE